MVSWQWLQLKLRAKKRAASVARRANSFRPRVGELEERAAPAGLGDVFAAFSPLQSAPATHLRVVTPEAVQAGKSFDVVVSAETASNRIATSYTGTVHFAVKAADTGATLPADYTFKASDHGVHVFHVGLTTTGAQTLSVTDTPTIAGSADLTINAPPVASQFVVRLPEHVTAGQPVKVTVAAQDSSGRPVSGYTGTVHLTSSGAAAVLPSDYTFTAADHGQHTFQVTLTAAGSQTLTVTDTAAAKITGTATTNVEAVGAVTHFAVSTLGVALAGSPTPVQIVALDASNHVVTNYTGTVHLTSSDSAATLPTTDFTFKTDDKGVHLFNVTFATAGKQTITATGIAASDLIGDGNVFVLSQLPTRGRHGR